ncbi:MAG: EAL domain-containing protein [Gammaproteobacteria bacterium]|nr:EAL domain-containing protein [Gammaproteobacteria bacterium]
MEKLSSPVSDRVREHQQPADIARLEAENARLNAILARAQLGLAAIGDAVIGTNACGHIDYLNAAAESMCGFSSDKLQGLPARSVFAFRSAETNARLANPLERCLSHGRPVARVGRSVLVARGGRGKLVQETATPVCDSQGHLTGAVLVLRDLSVQNQLSERLSWQHRHDPLTGLVNREEFERRLGREISLLGRREVTRHSLLCLDLDRFRVVNDTAGHAAGDRALLEVARLIQEQIRSSDVAARLGGDEFAILLMDCETVDAVRVAQQIGSVLEAHRFKWRDCRFSHTASIGVVSVAANLTPGKLLAAGDVACYNAKETGRNTVSFCPHNESTAGFRNMQWVSDIGQACDEGRFQLHCQPIVAITDESGVQPHFELLLRINDHDGKVIPAKDFLPAAERFNMMPTIDRWVLRHALSKLVCLADDANEAAYMLSVNLSGASLSDTSFLEFARSELERTRVAAGALCFEITETAAIDNIAIVARFIREMRQAGCKFSLDDFGSGLSSFAYLKELPVDFLKIDGRFIRNVHEDAVDYTMVRAIGNIGSAIGVKTVAERVECGETLSRLKALGIDYAQGFYFSRPVPVRDRSCIARLAMAAEQSMQAV